MTTAVSGLVKIGKTRTSNFPERMRFLEANGYYNVVGLKKYFAIELEDYDEKESLLHEIFAKHQVGTSELFALDQDLIRQLLLALDGRVVYPDKLDKEKEFDQVSTMRKQSALFSFYKKGLVNGNVIRFISDDTVNATIVGERDVEYNGQLYKLSPLTYKIFEEKGQLTNSGAYQGARYWHFNGKRLTELNDVA